MGYRMLINKWYLAENEPGLYIHAMREAKGYTMEEISHGICSLPTLSRIEAGERVVDYIMIEALLERMKVNKSEYEFVLDNDAYDEYMQREEIRKLVAQKPEEAEEKIKRYEAEHGTKALHQQFLFLQKGYLEKQYLEQNRQRISREQIGGLFQKAVCVTAPEYESLMEQQKILSNTELLCLVEMTECMEESSKKEKEYEKMYQYFQKCHTREKGYPMPYRTAMRYYAECLYANSKWNKCVKICNEVLEELDGTSRLENRHRMFELRAKAQEELGFETEEEKLQGIKDFLTAYYVADFFGEKEYAENLKKHIGERYGWQYIG